MKKPLFDQLQRHVILKTDSHHKNKLLYRIEVLRFKREIDRMIQAIIKAINSFIHLLTN